MKKFVALLAALLLLPGLALPIKARATGDHHVKIIPDRAYIKAGETVTLRLEVIVGDAPNLVTEATAYVNDFDNEAYPVPHTYDPDTLTWTVTPTFGTYGWVSMVIGFPDGVTYLLTSEYFWISGSEYHPLTGTLALDRATVKAGETIACKYDFTDGVPPFSLEWKWQVQESNGGFSGWTGTEVSNAFSGSLPLTPLIGETGW